MATELSTRVTSLMPWKSDPTPLDQLVAVTEFHYLPGRDAYNDYEDTRLPMLYCLLWLVRCMVPAPSSQASTPHQNPIIVQPTEQTISNKCGVHLAKTGVSFMKKIFDALAWAIAKRWKRVFTQALVNDFAIHLLFLLYVSASGKALIRPIEDNQDSDPFAHPPYPGDLGLYYEHLPRLSLELVRDYSLNTKNSTIRDSRSWYKFAHELYSRLFTSVRTLAFDNAPISITGLTTRMFCPALTLCTDRSFRSV